MDETLHETLDEEQLLQMQDDEAAATRPTLQVPNDVLVIGCGGVGSWLATMLAYLPLGATVLLVDGDKLEEKNLDRQIFDGGEVGRNKALALADRLDAQSADNVHGVDEYFHDGMDVPFGALLLCCVDNHPARLAVLRTCDRVKGAAIICGNEYIDADAYFYAPWMKGTKDDPRVFAPELLTNTENDPIARTGCTGEAQRATPQLVVANVTAATMAMRLLWYWCAEVPHALGNAAEGEREELGTLLRQSGPVMLQASAFNMWATKARDAGAWVKE